MLGAKIIILDDSLEAQAAYMAIPIAKKGTIWTVVSRDHDCLGCKPEGMEKDENVPLIVLYRDHRMMGKVWDIIRV